MNVTGAIDNETRCRHYHSVKDRIAIKFYCCGKYYSCYHCHAEQGCNSPKVWPKSMFNEKAVLCGACQSELTIQNYLDSGFVCPVCSASFNPGCSVHYQLYFS
ncbi:CHY zinc finger protein [Virgibacillus sp. DJP39]|uniref:CHY zinc finger protein n=1 Tax=Virgibacillus sp. DJP39 TaxID=3409790 RepID=UPI003BB7D110